MRKGDQKDCKDEKYPRKLRKEYTKPQLIEYGHVEKLTQTGGQTSSDGPFGQKMVG